MLALSDEFGKPPVIREAMCRPLGPRKSRSKRNPLSGGFFHDHVAQPLLLRSTYQDKDRQEDEIRKSGLNWTIVRPAMLSDGLATNDIQALTDLTGFQRRPHRTRPCW